MKDYGVEGFVEVKEPRHSVHPSQKRTLEELRKLGVKIGIVSSQRRSRGGSPRKLNQSPTPTTRERLIVQGVYTIKVIFP